MADGSSVAARAELAARGRMHGIGRLLRVNPGEGRIVARVLAMMILGWGGFAIGGNAVEGLLFARYGPSALPYLFVALGVVSAVVMLGMNALLARPRPHRMLLLFLPGMAVVIVGLRALLLVGARWVYPASWLVMMILWTLVGVVTWGIAGAVHDTRQAKRLFPLYGAGLIVGGVAGGLLTGPLAKALGAENLVLLWAAAAGAGFLPARSALRLGGAGGLARTRTRAGSKGPSAWRRIAEGARQVRSTGLLRWMFASLAMFAILYFTLSLLFARAATARYPSADRLAAFFGLFTAVASGAALVVSLFLSNRLAARFGLATMVLVLPVVYAVGFATLVFSTAFTAVLLFRFVQMVWVNGVWAGAWQAQYNVIPPERRDGTRAFIDGIGSQVGVAMAGVMLILAQTALPTRALPPIGLVVAVLAIAAAWRARRMYARAVVDALRAGNPEVFLPGGAPFGGDRPDAVATAAVVARRPVRRGSRRSAGRDGGARRGARPEALPQLLLGLDDGDPSVRRRRSGGSAASTTATVRRSAAGLTATRTRRSGARPWAPRRPGRSDGAGRRGPLGARRPRSHGPGRRRRRAARDPGGAGGPRRAPGHDGLAGPRCSRRGLRRARGAGRGRIGGGRPWRPRRRGSARDHPRPAPRGRRPGRGGDDRRARRRGPGRAGRGDAPPRRGGRGPGRRCWRPVRIPGWSRAPWPSWPGSTARRRRRSGTTRRARWRRRPDTAICSRGSTAAGTGARPRWRTRPGTGRSPTG